MRHPIACLVVLLAGLAAAMPAAAQTPFRPVATVNKQIITAFDLEQRMRILSVLGADASSQQQLQSIALDRLIEDRLRMQAAEEAGVEPEEDMMNRGLQEFASQIGITPQALATRFNEARVTPQALGDMLVSQLLWRDVVQDRFRGRVELGEADIDAELALAGRGNERFRLQEIGLPYTSEGRTEAETRALAERLRAELAAGGDFEAAVRRHSRAPSAEQGGDVGWVSSEDLPPAMAADLARAEIGGVLEPQPVQGGISILKLVDRSVETADVAGPEARERVRRGLMLERLDLLAQGYIQELRRQAMIEIR